MKTRQGTLNRFVRLPSSSEESSSDDYEPGDEEQKRGEASDWTRVKGRDQFTAKFPRVFDVGTDLRALRAEKIRAVDPAQAQQLVLWDPDTYKGQEQALAGEPFVLTREQLLGYAKMATAVRAAIDDKAKGADGAQAADEPAE